MVVLSILPSSRRTRQDRNAVAHGRGPRDRPSAVRAWMAKDGPGPKPTSDMADMIDLMLATGAGIGEVLALRWSDIDLVAPRPNLTINGTIKTEPGKGTYRKTTPNSAAGVRTVVLPYFAVHALCRRRESARARTSSSLRSRPTPPTSCRSSPTPRRAKTTRILGESVRNRGVQVTEPALTHVSAGQSRFVGRADRI
jgi:integrase